ncbi:MAG TPA: hypothetical protein VGY58_08455, partial [Gemmataceae bacterium]|nr:hypothetical protein [Gemmataceae bacterium]
FDQTFSTAQLSRLEIYGQGGNDHIEVDKSVLLPAMIFAGTGNDHIQTGDGNTVVVGGTGNNHIEGGAGRDILIGGTGNAHIDANGGQSILIAGVTAYGQNAEAYLTLEAEWASGDSLQTRTAAIAAGVGGKGNQFALNSQTVFANGFHNHLQGGSGMDWYFADLAKDKIDDLVGQDLFTQVNKQ